MHSWRTRLDIFSLEKQGKLHLQHTRYSEAEQIFSQLLDCGDIFWMYLSKSLLGQKKYKEARECIEKVLLKACLQTEWGLDAFKTMGFCCYYMGDIESAFENFNKALSLNNKTFDVEIQLGLGLILKEQKQYSSAKEKFQAVLEKDMNNDEAWAGLAEVRAELGDLELAHVNLQQSLDLNPENESALRLKVRWSSSFQWISGSKPLFSFRI